ncbi:hypothetical protein U4E84_13570, partial [Halorubrum sp. AD140]|uniref:RPA family protein n=1 Tax=Halorubrum sp. AD140 TaxID=3050073 RepID=UPI002ACCDBA8
MSDDGPGAREVAHRVFAAEFDDASLSYSESDEERAPNYVVTPTGARVNRLFVAGVLTEVERVNDETRRGRVVDPSGAFVTYAGQYQPEAQAFLERADPPSFVALTGKARTFEPEDSDRVFTSVRPESLNEVDADTRDRWVVSAAEATLDRLAVFAAALDSELRGEELRAALESGGAPASLAAGIPKAIAHYDTSTAYVEAVRRLAVDALELIAGDRDEVRVPEFAPDAGGDAAIGALPETDVTVEAPTGAAAPVEGAEAVADAGSEATADAETETTAESDGSETAESAETEATAETAATDDTAAESTAATDDTAAESTAATDEAGGLGDFETGGDLDGEETLDDDETDETDDTAASADPAGDELYELDDEEREEIESEFGTDFATGTEVDEPGEADIDVPDPEGLAEEVDDPAAVGDDAAVPGAESDEADAADPTTDDDGEAETDTDGDAAAGADDVDLEEAAVAAMTDLDDGDGAPREAVVERVADEHGVEPSAVGDAIQDALMSGQCY